MLETISQNELRIAGELELSRKEDSVMSLAVGGHDGKTTHVYAGVNSSPEDIAKGTNHHLRALALEQSKARASVGAKVPDVKIAEVSRNAFFANPDAETYQRLLRVAGGLGVAASGLGKEPQLAVFDTSNARLQVKGVLELPEDAEDLDVIPQQQEDGEGDGEYLVAFCHKYELNLFTIGKETSEPKLIFTMPDDHGERPQFRSIRFLTPDFILAVANLPKRNGVIIQGIRLPTPGHDMARVSVSVRIPGKISATALAVANVSPPSSLTVPVGTTQFVAAVADTNSSISLYTMDHRTLSTIDILADLHPLANLKNVHGGSNITGLAFSTFSLPKNNARPQFLKLASTTLQKTVSVHSIALKEYGNKTGPQDPKAAPRQTRYVIAMKSKPPSKRSFIIAMSIMALIMAIAGQSIMEIYGKSKPIIHAHKFVPSWHGTLRTPLHQHDAFIKEDLLSKLVGDVIPAVGEKLVMLEAPQPLAAAEVDVNTGDDAVKKIKVDVHDSELHSEAKSWEELGEAQKHAWKSKLQEAGAWTQGMGESVFKGILFGELAGAVGHALAG